MDGDRAGAWHADPTGRHERRWWDGAAWTTHVADGDEVATDEAPIVMEAPPAATDVEPATNAGLEQTVDALAAVSGAGKRYDAFISYSHGGDGTFAPRLQDGLHRLAKPWRQRRALEVFRDQTGLSVNPNLWTSICRAMDGSSYFVLLASPESSRSEWVGKEIERWVATKGVEGLLPVVTDGTWTWDPVAGDFAWDDPEQVTAVHPALRGVFREEPRHVDMSWARAEAQLTLRNARFRDQVAELAAPMHGVTKDELEGEDVRLQQRTRRLARGAVSLLVMLTAAALLATALAVASQREAVAQRDRAAVEARATLAQQLGVQARSGTAELPDKRLLTAVAADRIHSSSQSQAALLAALTGEHRLEHALGGHVGGVADLALTPSGEHLTTVDGAGQVRVWSPATGQLIAGPLALSADRAALGDDGRTLAVVDTSGGARWFDITSGDEIGSVAADPEVPAALTCDAFACGRVVATVAPDGRTVAVASAGSPGIRFLRADGTAELVANADAVVGLAWSPYDAHRLLVGDLAGLRVWSGADGPPSGVRPLPFEGATGILLGGVAFRPDSAEVALIVERSGWPGAVDTLGLASDGRVTRKDTTGFDDLGVRLGAVAYDPGYLEPPLVVGSDPSLGGPTQVQVITASGGERRLRDDLPRPLGAVTRMVGLPGGGLALGGLDEVVRIVGEGPVLRTDLGTLDDLLDDAPIVAGSEEGADAMASLPAVEGQVAISAARGEDVAYGLFVPADELGPTVIDSTGQQQWEEAPAWPTGELRAFDGGEDVTAAVGLAGVRGTSVAMRPSTGQLLVGTTGGQVLVFDPTDGERIETLSVADAPVQAMAPDPTGAWMVVRTTYELFLAESDRLTPAVVLVASRQHGRVDDALFEDTGTVEDTFALWDESGSLRFGRQPDADVRPGLGLPEVEPQGPFDGSDAIVREPEATGLGEEADLEAELDLRAVLPSYRLLPAEGEWLVLRVDGLAELACEVAGRNLSPAEWERLTTSQPYQEVCPSLPRPPEDQLAPMDRPAGIAAAPGEQSGGGPPADGTAVGDTDAAQRVDEFFDSMGPMFSTPFVDRLPVYIGRCLDVAPTGDEACANLLAASDDEIVASLDLAGEGTIVVVRLGREPGGTTEFWSPRTGDAPPAWVVDHLDDLTPAPVDAEEPPDREGFPGSDVFVPHGEGP